MEELISVLEKTVLSSQKDQNEAIAYIQQYIQRDLTSFLKILSDVLYNQSNSPGVRTAAGLQLKNQLTARDDSIRISQQDRWRNLPGETRQYIKERVFATLGTEVSKPFSAPQCVAYIAIAELKEKDWPGFIQALLENLKTSSTNDKLRLATLEAIDYICQEITSTEQQNQTKREITNGLNTSMSLIYSFIGDCISSQNYELMSSALQCLSGILSWAQSNDSLLRYLCQLIRNYDMLTSSVPHEFSEQKSAIISLTCDCLNVCLERKYSKSDSIDIRTSLYEDETNLHSIISTLDRLNHLSLQQDSSSPEYLSEVVKKLAQVITNVFRYVYVGVPEKPQNLHDMFTMMKVIITHQSIPISLEGIRFWNRVFTTPKKNNPSLTNDLIASLLITCANKLIRTKYDQQFHGYEFESQEEFDVFQGKYKSEVMELCRNLTVHNEEICFEIVSTSMAKSIQQNSSNLNEWDALSSLAAAVCPKLKDPSIYLMNGVELVKVLLLYMDNALSQAGSIPANPTGRDASLIPQLVSNQLSCVSALCVFLPCWHKNDKELTKELLNKIILYSFHRPDKFISSSRILVGNNTNLLTNESFLKGFRGLARHASACFVRICLNHASHLVDIFAHLKNSVDCLFAAVVDNPYSSEKCQLYEGLTLICNEESDEAVRKKFVLELFESIQWFKDYEFNCDQFIDFVGFNRLEVDQDSLNPQAIISQPISPCQNNRVKLTYVITFLGSIVKRLNSRTTLLPEILNFVRPILNIIYTMNALWLPEMRAKCLEEYRQFLFAPFNSSYKQQILDTILVNSSSNPNDSPSIADITFRTPKGNGQYIELFSWNFYESLLSTMGNIINKTSPELFTCINSMQLQTALTGTDYLPPLKMHKLIKSFIMPLINTCSKDQHLIETQLLPLLTKLLPFLFDLLDNKWKKYKDEESVNNHNGISNDQNQLLADEMVQDQLLRNLSRDFIDLLNMILIESIAPTPSTNNDNSIYNNTNINKIGTLGLNLLTAGSDFVMKVMATTLTWSDSTLNAKAIFVNQILMKHIVTTGAGIDATSMWVNSMFDSVIISLKMFGEHEQNCSGLLTLFLCLYDNLNKSTPNFQDYLERMTGVPKSAFLKFDQDSIKVNDKNKRANLRKLLTSHYKK